MSTAVPVHRLAEQIAGVADALSEAQSRVARLVDEAPSLVAFGTVAEVAVAADTSPQTVLRLAGRLGYDGFAALQEAVRAELMASLPAAADRIRTGGGGDLVDEVLAADQHNLAAGFDRDALVGSVALLADPARRVGIVAADSWVGLGALFQGQLAQLRAGVSLLDGPVPRVARMLAEFGPGDVLVVLDVHRYERWIVAVADLAVARGLSVIAVTDAVTAPIAGRADQRLVVAVASPGPFESVTGVVSLLHACSTLVADALRDDAPGRLDAIEATWRRAGALVE